MKKLLLALTTLALAVGWGQRIENPPVSPGSPGFGTVTNVSGTANEISVATGTTTPVISAAATFDISGHTSTAPVKKGTSLPATCGVGEFYDKTDATAGQNLYSCTATNTWTAVGGSSVSITGTAPIVVTPSPTTGTGVISAPTAVVGPSSATDAHLVVFDGVTGKLVKDGGVVPTGTVTSVTGTANQVSVATGTTTPVLSIPSDFRPPGTVTPVGAFIGSLTGHASLDCALAGCSMIGPMTFSTTNNIGLGGVAYEQSTYGGNGIEMSFPAETGRFTITNIGSLSQNSSEGFHITRLNGTGQLSMNAYPDPSGGNDHLDTTVEMSGLLEFGQSGINFYISPPAMTTPVYQRISKMYYGIAPYTSGSKVREDWSIAPCFCYVTSGNNNIGFYIDNTQALGPGFEFFNNTTFTAYMGSQAGAQGSGTDQSFTIQAGTGLGIDLMVNNSVTITMAITPGGLIGHATATPLGWSSSGGATGTIDSTFCRLSAGVFELGSSTGCAASGSVQLTAQGTIAVLTTNLKACSAGGSTPTGINSYSAAVSDAVAPALGVVLTGGGTVWAHVHCSLTTGTYLVDGI